MTTAYRCWREGALPVPARKVGRLILVAPDAAAAPSPAWAAGLYPRVSSHDHKADLDRQVARLSEWAAQAGLPVVRAGAEIGSGMNGVRPKHAGCCPTRRSPSSRPDTGTGSAG